MLETQSASYLFMSATALVAGANLAGAVALAAMHKAQHVCLCSLTCAALFSLNQLLDIGLHVHGYWSAPPRWLCGRYRFFQSTPTDLIANGLYSEIAMAFHEKPFREVSLALACQKLGATVQSELAKSIETLGKGISTAPDTVGKSIETATRRLGKELGKELDLVSLVSSPGRRRSGGSQAVTSIAEASAALTGRTLEKKRPSCSTAPLEDVQVKATPCH